MKAALILLMMATPAWAAPENTKQACTDGVDNDGDGHVDCGDQDCWDLTLCANMAPGTPLPGAPSPRKSGTTKLVLGAILLPLGVIIAAASAGPFVAAAGADSNSTRYQLYGVGGAMDGVGLIGMAAGTALLAVGAGELAASRERRVSLGPTSLRVTF
jgi:hypothetical protein